MMRLRVTGLVILCVHFAVSDDVAMENEKFSYRGPLASVFTPFNNDAARTLNLSVISKYAEFLSSKNVTGVLVAGTYGQGTALNIDERKRLVEAWHSVVKKTKQHLMIHVGGASLRDVKELAAHAESIGADSLLLRPELNATSTDEIINYLEQVGRSAPKTPLLFYQNPVFEVELDVAYFLTNVGKKVPTFVGMKHVTDDFEELKTAWRHRQNYTIFIGMDALTLSGCSMGMDSMITSTSSFIPELCFDVLRYCRNGSNFEKAREAQNAIDRIVAEIDRHGDDTVSMKVATSMLSDLPLGPPRPPLQLIPEENVKSMARELKRMRLPANEVAALSMY